MASPEERRPPTQSVHTCVTLIRLRSHRALFLPALSHVRPQSIWDPRALLPVSVISRGLFLPASQSQPLSCRNISQPCLDIRSAIPAPRTAPTLTTVRRELLCNHAAVEATPCTARCPWADQVEFSSPIASLKQSLPRKAFPAAPS